MNNEFLKYCKYYKGEDGYPPMEKDYNTFTRFWILERAYIQSGEKNHNYWQTEGLKMCVDSFPSIKEHIEHQPDLFARGMLACFAVTSLEHNPMGGVEFIKNMEKSDILKLNKTKQYDR